MLKETWLTDLTQHAEHEIFIMDADTLAFLHVNHAARINLQYSDSEFQQLTAPDLMRDLHVDQLTDIVKQLRSGSVEHFHTKTAQRRKDGSSYRTGLRLFYLHLNLVPALIAVSDNSKAGANEDRLSQIEAHLPGLLFQMRQGTRGCLYFPFLSYACHDLLGITAAKLAAKPAHFFDIILEEDRVSWLAQLQISAQNRTVLNWEGRISIDACKDIKWINLRATPQNCGHQGVQWTGLMTNISQSKKLEEEIRYSRAQLAELNAYVDQTKEDERARIERDLHDDLGGTLSAIKMMMGELWKRLPVDDPDIAERTAYLDSLVDRSLESVHRIAVNLRPGILEAGLVAALEWLAQALQKKTGIPFKFNSNVEDIAIPAAAATVLFRIAQEACNNIRKHAKSSNVNMYLYDGGNELQLEIIDNGCGIAQSDQQKKETNPKSFGLRSIKERVSSLSGTMSIASGKEKGTIITICVPLPISPTPFE